MVGDCLDLPSLAFRVILLRRESFRSLREKGPPHAHSHGHRRHVYRLRISEQRRARNSESTFAAEKSRRRDWRRTLRNARKPWRPNWRRVGFNLRNHCWYQCAAGAPRWTSPADHHGGVRGCARNRKTGAFFFNDTATTEIYTLSLHDALP